MSLSMYSIFYCASSIVLIDLLKEQDNLVDLRCQREKNHVFWDCCNFKYRYLFRSLLHCSHLSFTLACFTFALVHQSLAISASSMACYLCPGCLIEETLYSVNFYSVERDLSPNFVFHPYIPFRQCPEVNYPTNADSLALELCSCRHCECQVL